MLRSLAFLPVVCLLCGNATAESYVVDLECVVFDRDLTDAENEMIRQTINDLPRKVQGAAYGKEHLRLLRQNTNQLFVIKSTLILHKTETASQKLKTDRVQMEAHIRLIEANDESCQLDIQWGIAMKFDERHSSTGTHTEQRWVPLDTEQQISGGGGNNHYRQFIICVCKVTDDDLAPKKLPADFGREMLPQLPQNGVGGKLTRR